MFDLIGKRKWFYAFSLLLTIPGLIFILLTPFSGGQAGLKFSIDFTGGTVWEVHFQDGTPTPAQVHEVMTELGLPGTVAIAWRIVCMTQATADAAIASSSGSQYQRIEMWRVGEKSPFAIWSRA